MANYNDVNDLRLDALWRAGQPQDSSSSFWAKSLEYINRIQQTLLLGGGVAVGRDLASSAGIYAHLVDIPMTDWWWARSRGCFNTTAAIQTTVTVSQDSAALTFGDVVAGSLSSWRLQVPGYATVPMITLHTLGTATATLDVAWPEVAQSGASCNLLKIVYSLATDFLRFCSVPYLHSTFSGGITVASLEQRTSDYPLSSIRQGPPSLAYLTAPQTLEVNSWDTRGYRLEYEYIAMPPDLEAEDTPLLPTHHRAVLAVGAAMLMAFDLGDGRAANLASEYREMVQRMVQEHRRMMSGGSAVFGQIKPRAGLPRIRGQQPLGSLYLI